MSDGRAVRRVLTGAGAVAAVLGMAVFRSVPLVVAGCSVVLVVISGRSRLSWLGSGPAGAVLRRCSRTLVYLVPLLFVSSPLLRPSLLPLLIGVVAGALPILASIPNLRLAFSDRYLTIATITGVDRLRDTIYFVSGGAAQEFLYRGLVLAALLPFGTAIAVTGSAALFAVEHLLHPGGLSRVDRHDLIVQLYLGVVLGVLVAVTGSLFAAIAGHTVYNLPNLVLTLRRRRDPGEVTPDPVRTRTI